MGPEGMRQGKEIKNEGEEHQSKHSVKIVMGGETEICKN